MTFETDNQPENEQNASDSTHAPILSGQEQLARREAEFRALMSKRTDPSVELFYEKLRARLKVVGIDLDKLDYKSDLSTPPPCFVANGANFEQWLKYASVGAIPIRMDMPGEPNYCNDCLPEFKLKAVACGTCLFPHTRFETRRESGEPATSGVSRSNRVAPSEYVVYQEMTVPVDALDAALKRFAMRRMRDAERAREALDEAVRDQAPKSLIRQRRFVSEKAHRERQILRLSDAPESVSEAYLRINWGHGAEKGEE